MISDERRPTWNGVQFAERFQDVWQKAADFFNRCSPATPQIWARLPDLSHQSHQGAIYRRFKTHRNAAMPLPLGLFIKKVSGPIFEFARSRN
jgi:hypothetical protein